MITIHSPNMLIVDTTDIFTQDFNGQILLDKAPTLTFEYKNIRYYAGEQLYSIDGTNFVGLSPEQQDEIEQFILSKRNEFGILKLAVDSDGKYLGLIGDKDTRITSTIDLPPPNQDAHWRWNFELNKWMPKYSYDAEGILVTEDSDKKVGSTFVPHPNKQFYKFDIVSQTWYLKTTSDEFAKYKTFLKNKLCGIYFSKLIDVVDAEVVYAQLKVLDDNIFNGQVITKSFDELNSANTVGQLESTIELATELISETFTF